MKQIRTFTISICLLLMPQVMLAQQNIKRAFENFINNNRVQSKESHSKTRNPETNEIVGKMDSYTFTIKASDMKLIDELKSAIRRDSEKAYSENWESAIAEDANYKRRTLMYNDKEGIVIGLEYVNYVNVNFIDEANKNFRYAYAVEWNEPEKDVVTGRIIISYARIPKFKNQQILKLDNSFDQFFSQNNINQKTKDNASHWLARFNVFRNNFILKPNSNSAHGFVSQIYELCKNASCLDEAEVKMVTEVLEEMLKQTSDKMLRGMLQASIENIKKK